MWPNPQNLEKNLQGRESNFYNIFCDEVHANFTSEICNPLTDPEIQHGI